MWEWLSFDMGVALFRYGCGYLLICEWLSFDMGVVILYVGEWLSFDVWEWLSFDWDWLSSDWEWFSFDVGVAIF